MEPTSAPLPSSSAEGAADSELLELIAHAAAQADALREELERLRRRAAASGRPQPPRPERVRRPTRAGWASVWPGAP